MTLAALLLHYKVCNYDIRCDWWKLKKLIALNLNRFFLCCPHELLVIFQALKLRTISLLLCYYIYSDIKLFSGCRESFTDSCLHAFALIFRKIAVGSSPEMWIIRALIKCRFLWWLLYLFLNNKLFMELAVSQIVCMRTGNLNIHITVYVLLSVMYAGDESYQ